jgi:signal transduction histidine kinase
VAATAAQTLSKQAALAAQQQVGLRAGPLAGTALADPARLRQVLMNLLGHAIRSSRPQGEVVVGFKPFLAALERRFPARAAGASAHR